MSDHVLYCPACNGNVIIPYATEISSRSCPVCGSGAETLWPTQVMFERNRDLYPMSQPSFTVDRASSSPVVESEPETKTLGRKRK